MAGGILKTELNREVTLAAGFRFAIVVSRWNDRLTSKLATGALEALLECNAGSDAVETFYVPGAFELPIACLKAARSRNFDAVIALGVVIRGDTPHFEYVAGETARGIMQVSLETGTPVLFGVITADDIKQAEARSGDRSTNKGYEAALSAVEMARLMREMNSPVSISLTKGSS